MTKKCGMCGEEALYLIKGTTDFYCQGCAKDSFGDLSCLQKIEEQAKALKKIVKEYID